MTPRMEKLQRQRALLQEHLRWLESEIASEASTVPAGISESSEPAAAAPVVPSPTAVAPTESPGAIAAPDATALVPEADVRGIHSDVRSGCLLYFILAFVALAAVVGLIYWLY